jgi:rare lipoprotein A (peptidoglycan hydrolase)
MHGVSARLALGGKTLDGLNRSWIAHPNNLCESRSAHRLTGNSHLLMDIRHAGTPRAGIALGRRMLSRHKLLLTLLLSTVSCVTVDAANAEVASVYGGSDGLCGSRTANGELVDCLAMTAAHRTLPFGSRVTVCDHGCVVVRINDRGPFVAGGHIDLTPAAARAIGLTEVGHVSLSR